MKYVILGGQLGLWLPHELHSALVVGIDLTQCRQRAITASIALLVHQVAVLDIGVIARCRSLQHDHD